MLDTWARRRVLGIALLVAPLSAPLPSRAALAPELSKQLGESQYVYIQSQRKDGNLGKPAEIWFFVHDGAVYVGSKKTSFRARRIKAGRKAAEIHIGKVNGPAFPASGEIIDDAAIWQLMFAAYAEKYADGWKTHEKNFRQGAADGTFALIRYTPK